MIMILNSAGRFRIGKGAGKRLASKASDWSSSNNQQCCCCGGVETLVVAVDVEGLRLYHCEDHLSIYIVSMSGRQNELDLVPGVGDERSSECGEC